MPHCHSFYFARTKQRATNTAFLAYENFEALVNGVNGCASCMHHFVLNSQVQPAEEEVQPAEEESQPAEEEVQPAEEEVQPAEEEVQPAEEEAQPLGGLP